MRTFLRAATRALNSTRVLVVSDGDGATRRALRAEASAVLGPRALWMDDHVPPWYAADYDTPSERATHARSAVEQRLCARARRFVGSLAAPSTHAICHLRQKGGRGGSGGPPPCGDALGRTLPARWAFF